jgi:hypothetical protein
MTARSVSGEESACCPDRAAFSVEDVTKGIEFEHRMMDYNNLPSTRFSDIKRVLKMATDRVSARLAAQKKQGK